MPMPADEFWDAADGYLVRAAEFIGHIQRLDEPLGSYRKHGRNDSDVFATAGGMAEGLRRKIRWTQRELNVTRGTRYAIARSHSPWPRKRRGIAIGVAVATALGPAPMAVMLLRSSYDPKSRPRWLSAFSRRSHRPSLS
jgi:hypothetical protein